MTIPTCLAYLDPSLTSNTGSQSYPPSHRRAAAFSLSRYLTAKGKNGEKNPLVSIVHRPFQARSQKSETNPRLPALSIETALTALTSLIANTDPSPILISSLLSPIIPQLYALMEHLEGLRASDPYVVQLSRNTFITWGKIISLEEGVEVLWSIVRGYGGTWHMNEDGKDFEWSPG